MIVDCRQTAVRLPVVHMLCSSRRPKAQIMSDEVMNAFRLLGISAARDA